MKEAARSPWPADASVTAAARTGLVRPEGFTSRSEAGWKRSRLTPFGTGPACR